MARIAIVTGANTGLGFAVSSQLLRQGYKVIMACRSEDKALAACSALRREQPGADLTTASLDISSPESVASFAAGFLARYDTLDLLVNNAGITGMPLLRTPDGHELHLATNYLGPYALTGRLLPCLEASHGARIVNVNSLAHRLKGADDLGDLGWMRDDYQPMIAYGRSKFALMMYTLELARRLGRAGSKVLAASAHPGFAATDILAKPGSAMAPRNWLQKTRHRLLTPLIPSPDNAARSTVFAALGDLVKPGDYFGPGGFFEIAGTPARARINPAAFDESIAAKLWKATSELTGTRYLER